MNSPTPAEVIIHGGRIATLDRARPFVSALAIARGRVLAIGDLDGLAAHRADATVMIDLKGRTVVPGLNDSHMHIVREDLTYNMERRLTPRAAPGHGQPRPDRPTGLAAGAPRDP
jgi:predicted amidohydrolase YtcJ